MAPFGTILVTVASFTFSSRAALRCVHPPRHRRRRRAAALAGTAAAGILDLTGGRPTHTMPWRQLCEAGHERSCFDCLMGWCGLDHLGPSRRARRRFEPADAHRRSGKGNRLRQGWVASLARRLRNRPAAEAERVRHSRVSSFFITAANVRLPLYRRDGLQRSIARIDPADRGPPGTGTEVDTACRGLPLPTASRLHRAARYR